MRTEIFTEAWRLKRTYGVSFSKALTIAWSVYKTDALASKINDLEANCYTSEQKFELEKMTAYLALIWVKRNELLTELTANVEFSNSGAEAYYNCGHYNGD